MATNPETIEDREQPFIKRVVEVMTSPATSKRSRERIAMPAAAALAALAPMPAGALAVALIVFVALDSR